MTDFFRIVKIEGSPLEMGRGYGRQAADLILEFVRDSRNIYGRIGYTEKDIQTIRERHEDGIGSHTPEIIEQIRGMAEGAGVGYQQMMDACLQHELHDALPEGSSGGCTTCLISGRATAMGEPIIGHNWDSKTDPRKVLVTLAKPKNGFRFISIGPVGRPGCEGMNEKGLTIVMSGVVQKRCKQFLAGTGLLYASPEWTHHIFQDSKNVEEALTQCREFRSAIHGVNWIVGDSREFAHVEIAHDEMNVTHLDPESPEETNWFTSTTNHYASHKLNSLGPSIEENPGTYVRRNRMMNLLQSNVGKIDLDLAKAFLRDHEGPYPVCRHGGTGPSTISCEIGQPKDLRFWIAVGPPCSNEFQLFSP